MLYNVTFETFTPESLENGEADESGYIIENCESLREAIDHWGGEGCEVGTDSSPITLKNPPRWFRACRTNDGTREFYEQGIDENRSLHLPDNITPSSAIRVARLLGCRIGRH